MFTSINHSVALFIYHLSSQNIWTESFAIVLSEGFLVLAFIIYVIAILPLRKAGIYVRSVFHDIGPAALTAIVGFIMKYFIPSARPYVVLHLVPLGAPTDPFASFPSLHAAVITAFATTIFYAHPKLGKYIAYMVPFVMLGRVAAGVHWLTDVIVGAAIGFTIAFIYHHVELGIKRNVRK